MAEVQRFRLNSPSVVAEAIEAPDVADGEAIIVHLETGTYYSIKGEAILLWNAIVGGATVEEISEVVAEMTGEPADRVSAPIRGFVDSLAAQGLIVDAGKAAAPPVVDLSGGGAGLLEPSFELYSDMQDLILLDPVHEVDERGWPHVQPTA